MFNLLITSSSSSSSSSSFATQMSYYQIRATNKINSSRRNLSYPSCSFNKNVILRTRRKRKFQQQQPQLSLLIQQRCIFATTTTNLFCMKKNNDDDDTHISANDMRMNEKFDPVDFIPNFIYIWFLLGYLFPSVVVAVSSSSRDEQSQLLLQSTQLVSESAKLLYLITALRARNFDFSLMSFRHKSDVGVGVLFGLATAFVARFAERVLLFATSSASTSSDLMTPSAEMLISDMYSLPSSLIALGISSIFLAPVTEELFFRGVMLDYFTDIFRDDKNILANITVVAGIFALAHLNLNPEAFVNLFICGIGFGCAFLFSEKNIAVAILAHSIYNSTVQIESLL